MYYDDHWIMKLLMVIKASRLLYYFSYVMQICELASESVQQEEAAK